MDDVASRGYDTLSPLGHCHVRDTGRELVGNVCDGPVRCQRYFFLFDSSNGSVSVFWCLLTGEEKAEKY